MLKIQRPTSFFPHFVTFITVTLLCLIFVALTSSECSVASNVATHKRERVTHNNRGVILWSYGRSATGSFMSSLQKTSNLKFCNGNKESFNRVGPRLSSSSFVRCVLHQQLLVHITPTDLFLVNSTLRTPEAVFQAAYKAGFRTVVTNFRENQLARDVSHYRQDLRQRRVPKIFVGVDDLIKRFEEMKRFWIRGVKAARKIGLTVVPCSFAGLLEDVCPCVRTALLALSSLSTKKSSKCNKVENHVQDAKKEKTLESLIPPELAAWMREQVMGTEYEWMLNLSATDWPKDVAQPVPMPTRRPNSCPGLLARLF